SASRAILLLPPPSSFLFLSAMPRPPTSTLFPYTTLFRSLARRRLVGLPSDRDLAGRRLDGEIEVVHAERAAHGDRIGPAADGDRSEEHTSELQSRENLVCRLLLEKKNTQLDARHEIHSYH